LDVIGDADLADALDIIDHEFDAESHPNILDSLENWPKIGRSLKMPKSGGPLDPCRNVAQCCT